MNLIDDLETSNSWDIFPTPHAIFSRKQINIISIRLALAGLILWASLQLSFTPILPCLIFFARIFLCIERKLYHLAPQLAINGYQLLSIQLSYQMGKIFIFFKDFFKKKLILQGCKAPRTLKTFL